MKQILILLFTLSFLLTRGQIKHATESWVTTQLGTKQAADADLTTYAGITPSTMIQNFLGIANPSAVRFFRVNADNTITLRTAVDLLSDLGGVPEGRTLTIGGNTFDLSANRTFALVKGDVGLTNVDNTSDANKPVSTATQTALDLKATIASPTFTGTPAAPTPAAGTNTTQLATTAFATAAAPNSSWRTLFTATASHTAAQTANTYQLGQGDIAMVTGTGRTFPGQVFYIDDADYPSVNGVTTKLRVRAVIEANDVAPTGTYIFGLYPVTRPGTSGAATVVIYTMGTVVASSQTATFNAPAADSQVQQVSAEFAVPADGFYVLGFVQTGTVAASSHMHMYAYLQYKN